MKIIAVIPARFGSTRFPGKPLERLKGKPIIQWCIEGTKTSKYLKEIIVATDHLQIAEVAKAAGAKVVMTDPQCPTGTDRIFQATQNLDFDVVLNVQGDEPLISQAYLDPLAEAFLNDNSLPMATLAHPLSPEDLENKNAVKVITNVHSDAIYFSRFPIPYSREKAEGSGLICMKHIGLYGFKREFLQKFCSTPVAPVEKAESLEQLRALHLGARIKVIQVAQPTYGVDTPEDLQKLEALLK